MIIGGNSEAGTTKEKIYSIYAHFYLSMNLSKTLTFSTGIWHSQIRGNLSKVWEKRYFLLRFLKLSRRPYSSIPWNVKNIYIYAGFKKRKKKKEEKHSRSISITDVYIQYMMYFSSFLIFSTLEVESINEKQQNFLYKLWKFPRFLGSIAEGAFISIFEQKVLKCNNLSADKFFANIYCRNWGAAWSP